MLNKEEFEKYYNKKVNYLPINTNEKQNNDFFEYMRMLLEWNEKMNLTAITGEYEVIDKHFIDSLTIAKYIKNDKKVIDVGTGAGFPGIPIKIVKNELDITLLDSLNKRLNFLNEVINYLNLKKIKTVHSRIEDAGQNNEFRAKFDIATSRAVAPLNILLEYMLPLVKKGGICICMKGNNVDSEIEKAKNALKLLGGKIEKTETVILPETDITRNILIVQKIKDTPKQYPRKSGIPSKKPL